LNYLLEVGVPTLDQELKYCNYILQIKKLDKDTLLLLEIAKHIPQLNVDNIIIDNNTPVEDVVEVIKSISPNVLAKCVTIIDGFKRDIKKYYKQNNYSYKYSIDLLVP
jgi:hypothetical protein